ncbi:adenosine deaminase family protein [Microbacterium neimengense]
MTTFWVDADDPLVRRPKVSLHDHLDGSLRPATILELAEEARVATPRRTPAALQRWLSHFAEEEPGADWELLFGLSTSVMQTREQLRRVAAEYVETLTADGVVYAETRWAPEKHLAGGLTMDEAVSAVADGIAEGTVNAARGGHEIVVRQVLSVMRTAHAGAAVLAAARRGIDAGVVGIDLAGHEEGHPARDHARIFEDAARAGLSRTVHAGEADGAESIRDAVALCHAQRIGHGARLAEDIALAGVRLDVRAAGDSWHRIGRSAADLEPGEIAQQIIDDAIVLELCPTSNVGHVVDALPQHPIDLLAAVGVRVSVNVDNRMISATSVTREMRRVSEAFGWSMPQLRDASLAAADASFAPPELRERIRARVAQGWDDAVSR